MRERAGPQDVADAASGWAVGQSLLQRAGIEHPDDTAVIEDRPGARSTLAIKFRGLLKGELRGQSLPGWLHALEDLTLAFEATRIGTGQVNAVLAREDLVDGFALEFRGDKKTDQVGDHKGDDDRVIARSLEDHHHGSHGSA